MTIKLLDEEDETMMIEAVNLAIEFANESEHNPVIDLERCYTRLYGHALDGKSDVICVMKNDTVAALAIVAADQDFTEDVFGYIVKLYVRQQFRGTKVGREMMVAVEDWFDGRQATKRFATATAGVGQNKAFTNLLGKYGYGDIGPTLMKTKKL